MMITTNRASYKNTECYDPFENMTEEEINIFDAAYKEWLEEVEEYEAREKEMEEQRRMENQLTEYYEKYIKGNTETMLAIGNDICMMAYDIYHTLPEEVKTGYIFDKSLDKYYLDAYEKEHPEFSREYLQKCLDFANNWSFYSDMYKDTYGFRPRYI